MPLTITGALIAGIVLITAALILLLPTRVLRRPLFRQPAPLQLPKAAPISIEQLRLIEERQALATAWRQEARARELELQLVPLIELEADRLARLIVDGITTRGNAIHRLTAMIRRHTRPDGTVAAFLQSMREPQA
jgi:hypothetical protein